METKPNPVEPSANITTDTTTELPETDNLALPTTAAGTEMDLEALRLPQDYTQMMATSKTQLIVPIAKPNRQMWFQPHPDPKWRGMYSVIELKDDRESYIVAPDLREALLEEWTPKMLVACQSRQGTFFLWPIRIPATDGRVDTWSDSAKKIVDGYAGKWIRVIPDMQAGGYSVIEPANTFPAPVWPKEGFKSLVLKAFNGRIIDKEDHPVVLKLRGQA